MLNKTPKSKSKKKRLVDKISFLNKLFSKNNPKNTSQNYNELVSKFHSKIKKSS
jgi:hypothetical protein